MTTGRPNAEKNLKDFLEKHGKEGFLKLLLRNYLYELAMYYLHSSTHKPIVTEDTGYQFYVDGYGRSYRPEQIDEFKKDLKLECSRKADQIVDKINNLGILKDLDKDFFSNPKIAELVQQAFESIVKPEGV